MDTYVLKLPESLYSPAAIEYFDGTWNPGTITNGPDTYTVLRDFTWNITITNTSDAFLVAGTIKGAVAGECGRCLDEFTLDIDGVVEGYFAMDESQTEVPDELGPDELMTLTNGDSIDVEPLLFAAVLLELPLVALCSEDCKGLCCGCGANLNHEPCTCDADAHDDFAPENPFAVLSQLKFDE